jgi:hypothetical protein
MIRHRRFSPQNPRKGTTINKIVVVENKDDGVVEKHELQKTNH